MIKSFKFKIKRPSKGVVARFEQTLTLCRELYNAALQERRDAWDLIKVSISYYDQANQLPEIKLVRDDLTEVYGQVLQEILRRTDKTFKAFFARVKRGEKAGFPRFKGANFFDSFTYSQKGFKLTGDRLKLSKIGTVRIRLSRLMTGKVKTLTVKRETYGWFVIFKVECDSTVLPKIGAAIGIDVGIEHFATLSDGTHIQNPKHYEEMERKLRIAGRSIARKKKGSQLRLKAVLRLRKIHQKIKNQRNDFAHKISSGLVKDYDLIAIEKLNVRGMSKGILAKQIHDAAWSSFFHKLRYKAENAGRSVIEVNPRGTSQSCLCGASIVKTLSKRWHDCTDCGFFEHRDVVSARVILKLGLGHNLKDVTYQVAESVSLESSIINFQN